MKYYKANSGELIKKQDYSKIVLFDQNNFPKKDNLLQIATIYPQTKQRLHYHDKQTTVLYILQGECLLYINGQELMVAVGDALICEPGDKHYFWNKTEKDFTFVVFKLNLPEQDDTHWED